MVPSIGLRKVRTEPANPPGSGGGITGKSPGVAMLGRAVELDHEQQKDRDKERENAETFSKCRADERATELAVRC